MDWPNERIEGMRRRQGKARQRHQMTEETDGGDWVCRWRNKEREGEKRETRRREMGEEGKQTTMDTRLSEKLDESVRESEHLGDRMRWRRGRK